MGAKSPIGPSDGAGLGPQPEPVGPLWSVGPVGPVRPAGTERKLWGLGPEGPARPVGPVRPATPAGPVGPVGPMGPARPLEPGAPVGPATSATLATPAGPVTRPQREAMRRDVLFHGAAANHTPWAKQPPTCARRDALGARRGHSSARRIHFGMRSPLLSTSICTRSGSSLQRPSTLCVALISAQQALSRLW